MVKRLYVPDDKRIPVEFKKIRASLDDIQSPTGTEKNRSLLKLQEAVDAVEEAVEAVEVVVAELNARSSRTQSLSDLSVTQAAPPSTPGSVLWGVASRIFTPQAPVGGGRYVDISVSGSISGSNSSGSMPTAHLQLLQNGGPVASEVLQVPPSGAVAYPSGWNTRFRVATDTLLGDSSAVFTLRLSVGVYYGGGTTTITLSDIAATTRYGQLA